jgi:NAD(P)-dependent dehydrogenase (short-subunit alcohol dehydrogenase family)
MKMRFANKVALVTGAGAGIGKSIALSLARDGADVIVNDINGELASAAADEVHLSGRRGFALAADVGNETEVNNMVEQSIGIFGRIDFLVNNAGIPDQFVPTVDQSVEHWQKVIDTHLKGCYLCSKTVGRYMIERKSGKIINISSVVGISGAPMRTAYGPAKAGIIMLTKTLAVEWARYSINVNAVSPGYVLTSMVQKGIDRGIIDDKVIRRRIPMGRFASPEEVSGAVLFLLSDAANYVNGINLPVDGGFTAFGTYGDAFVMPSHN